MMIKKNKNIKSLIFKILKLLINIFRDRNFTEKNHAKDYGKNFPPSCYYR